MGRLHIALTAILAASCAYLVYANSQLRSELASQPPISKSGAATASSEATTDNEPANRRPSLLARLGRSKKDDRELPSIKSPEKESRADRRKRRREEMRALLGRDPDESDEDYRARLRPMVVAGLAEPRVRLGNERKRAEDAAGVSDEQRDAIDGILADTYSEAMDLANQAIQGGDVSPYRPNWAGTLQVAGGIGSVLSSTEDRIGEVLSPDQQQILFESGFEWGEYIGANAPWEDLRPPPPPNN